MQYIRSLKNITKGDGRIAGGKGASLGELIQAGISVPRGFMLTTAAFDSFLQKMQIQEEIHALVQKVDRQKIHTLEYVSEVIRGLILSVDMPIDMIDEIEQGFANLGVASVAVRSSATREDGLNAAWAGQLDSFLNTTQERLIKNIQKCWASLYTPRALFYRMENNLQNEDISIAVIIQKMIQSEVSGVAFSVHPVTEDPGQLVIEAGYGLGEALVSGSLTPDTYIVGKGTQGILQKNISKQEKMMVQNTQGEGANMWKEVDASVQKEQKLSDDAIVELTKIIMEVEKHYGFPVDVEWVCENGKFFVVQSRPITTLGKS
ncbi:MAG: hypothetical protein COV59_04490 [Candidatus Magasanikbacteria bacterium CG11_big_fil_rev_8_21_14_0_20_39_34]|uniref:Phosphoenolpyruvate synthase n=1 Tax=Candidatus Magasanikbacteria bacterium CG11_big_fil_rev_8_21_14_0_20_39_34 TaxID=1974653 RepID=A0A2H0N492_9BACT|nr:MAG: hypothetical protein COV59_04490 [Candidatus Magasanikbacteria bacterium CG11_big_fil_rev_8_21_14_0_20_39_34]